MNKSTNTEQDRLSRLFARLDENLTTLQGEWEQMSRYDLICNSAAITAVRQIHEYLTTAHGIEPEEVDYLLLFDNPLKAAADKWQERMEDTSDLCFALDEVFEKQDVLQSYAMSSTECRPSVLEKLRTSAERTPARAIKDKEAEIC